MKYIIYIWFCNWLVWIADVSASQSLHTWKSSAKAKHEINCSCIDDTFISHRGIGCWLLLWKSSFAFTSSHLWKVTFGIWTQLLIKLSISPFSHFIWNNLNPSMYVYTHFSEFTDIRILNFYPYSISCEFCKVHFVFSSCMIRFVGSEILACHTRSLLLYIFYYFLINWFLFVL